MKPLAAPQGPQISFILSPNNLHLLGALTGQPRSTTYQICDLGKALALCTSASLSVELWLAIMELIIVYAAWICCRIKQVIVMKEAGAFWEYKSRCPFPHRCPSKMNLELLTGKGAAGPHSQPLSGLAVLGVCVFSRGTVSPGTWPWLADGQSLGNFEKDGLCQLVQHLFSKQWSLHGQPWLRILFLHYLSNVIAKKSLDQASTVVDTEGLTHAYKGSGPVRGKAAVFIRRHKRIQSVRCQGWKRGWEGK